MARDAEAIERRYMSRKEIAKYLDVSTQSIDLWRRRGWIPYIKLGDLTNSRVLFDVQDVNDFMERRKYNTLHRGYNEGLRRTGGFRPLVEEPEYIERIEDEFERPPEIY